MSSHKSQGRNLAAIDRRIDQKIGKGQVITGIAEVVTEDGRAARVRLLGSGVLTDVAIVRGAQINPGDHVILLRPTDNDQWVCLGGYIRRVVNTQGSTTLNDLTGLSDPNNLQVIPGPGLLFLTWDSPAQRPDLTWFVQMAEISDNEWLNPITYSRGGSTLVVTGDPGEYRMFRIRAVDKNWNRSEWSGIASGAFGSTAVGSGSGGGASAFLDLLDTPSSYSSQALKYLRVASMENGVEFAPFPDHDHSGDAGDGGQFDAANLTSGTALSGHVLTADGAGDAFWAEQEDPHAFHDNQTAEFQGLSEKASLATSDVFVIEDSIDSYIKKKVYANNLSTTDSDAIHDNVSGEINAVTEKASPVGADVLLIEDSADTYAKKRVQITNLPAGSATDNNAIHDNVSGEIALITEKTTLADNDLLLIEDSAASNAKKSVKVSNLPGGGNETFIEDWSNDPGGAEGDLWFPDDGGIVYRYPAAGTAMYRGPLFNLTPPNINDFAWINQDNADVDLGLAPFIYLYDGPNGMGYHILKKSAPTTPYQVTAGIMGLGFGVNYSMFGIGWRDSTDGKLALFRIFYGAGWEIQANYASDPDTDIGTYYGTYLPGLPHVAWMRIKIQDGYRSCHYSVDGFHFIQLHSVEYNNYCDPNEVLFFVNPYQNTHDVGMTLIHWKEEEL